MQLALLFLTQAIIISRAQGFVDLNSLKNGVSFSQFDQRIFKEEQSAQSQASGVAYANGQGQATTSLEVTATPTSSSATATATAYSSGNTVQNIVDAITSGDFDVISQAIKGAASTEVATAFISATEQGATLQNLARFIVQAVQKVPADTQSVNKIAEAFNIMADQGACDTILAVFSEIESFVVDDAILENLLDTFSAQKVLDCAAIAQSSPPPPSAGAPAPVPVPFQDTCREGGTSCQWWQKENRSLLNNNSQCQQRYVCNFYGFASKSECQRQCL